MLHRLRIDPFANQLLLAAHVNDQALDGFGEVRHRARCPLAWAAVRHDVAQTLDHRADFSARVPHRGGHIGGRAAEIAHRGREPVLQIRVEPVLGLAGLQVEKAQDQRSGETE